MRSTLSINWHLRSQAHICETAHGDVTCENATSHLFENQVMKCGNSSEAYAKESQEFLTGNRNNCRSRRRTNSPCRIERASHCPAIRFKIFDPRFTTQRLWPIDIFNSYLDLSIFFETSTRLA